jgi:hypothetical protein
MDTIMDPANLMENALQNPEPALALRAVVRDLAAKGYSKAEIYDLFERLLTQMRSQTGHHASREEPVLDVMDTLTNWCHPDAQLLP